jgi:hypothetical protein
MGHLQKSLFHRTAPRQSLPLAAAPDTQDEEWQNQQSTHFIFFNMRGHGIRAERRIDRTAMVTTGHLRRFRTTAKSWP